MKSCRHINDIIGVLQYSMRSYITTIMTSVGKDVNV